MPFLPPLPPYLFITSYFPFPPSFVFFSIRAIRFFSSPFFLPYVFPSCDSVYNLTDRGGKRSLLFPLFLSDGELVMKRRAFYPLFESRAKAKVLYANAEFYLHALGVKREGEREGEKRGLSKKERGGM